MPETTVRPAAREDAAAIAEVANAESQALYGEADVDATAVEGWFDLPDIAMFVAEQDGRVVGYADVRDEGDGARFPIDIRAVPGAGAGDALAGAVEVWASERAAEGGQLRAFAAERDAEYQAVLARRGYELVRHSFQMGIDVGGELAEPVWPEGITVRTYDHERDEVAVYEAVQESFADHWEFHPISLDVWRGFRKSDLRFDPELWWLAEEGGVLAGVSLNAWHHSGDPTFGWVNTLGVRRPWRRRGLALALLLHSFRDFAARGATRIGLGVDAENTTGAVRLYERAGMRPVRRDDSWFKTL